MPTLVLRTCRNGFSLEIDKAARMDGASEARVCFRSVLPNIGGPMAAVFFPHVIWIRNGLPVCSILAMRHKARSIRTALLAFQGCFSRNIVMTAALIASIPTVLRLGGPRRQFMEGLRCRDVTGISGNIGEPAPAAVRPDRSGSPGVSRTPARKALAWLADIATLTVPGVEDLPVVNAQHESIAEAILSGDATRAETQMRRIFAHVVAAHARFADDFAEVPS